MEHEVKLIDAPEQASLDDGGLEDDFNLTPLATDIMQKFDRSKRDRLDTEQRWVKAYYNHRGIYNKNIKFVETEKSRVFIKITKTKVQAAYGQLLDILFSSGSLPISIEPTKVPEGIEDVVHFDPRDPAGEQQTQEEDPVGFEGDGNPLEAGDTLSSRLGRAVERMYRGAKAKLGPADETEEKQVSPAQVAANKMEKKIQDQLTETNAVNHLCAAIFEMVLLGTGIIKGPFVENKEYPRWDKDGNYNPIIRPRPMIEQVSLWDFFPDPSAKNIDEADWTIQRHRMSKSELRALKKRPFFRPTAINEVIETGPRFDSLWWESELSERNQASNMDRFEVLEYWGIVDRDHLVEELEVDLPEELDEEEEFQINAWISNGQLIRVVLNPFKPKNIPYMVSPYEQDPYNFFGVGLPENMEDSQTLMNGFARMAIDNAVLAGNVMLEVDETNLVPGQDFSIYAGKIWRRQGGAPGQAIFATTFPSTANVNMQMFDKFRALADDSTGLPSFSHGQTGVTGIGRTASGISMLLNAASLQTKTGIKNIDINFLQPLGERMFAFNMQFDFDPEIVGDLEVKARGTVGLLQKEVRSQRLLQFLQVSASPIFAPMVNYEYLIEELAEVFDLDKEKILLDPKKAAIQIALMAKAQQALGPSGPQTNGVTGPEDPTGAGGGNIGTGVAPQPNEAGFSGTPQATGPTDEEK